MVQTNTKASFASYILPRRVTSLPRTGTMIVSDNARDGETYVTKKYTLTFEGVHVKLDLCRFGDDGATHRIQCSVQEANAMLSSGLYIPTSIDGHACFQKGDIPQFLQARLTVLLLLERHGIVDSAIARIILIHAALHNLVQIAKMPTRRKLKGLFDANNVDYQ